MFRAVQFGLSNAWRPLDPHQGSWRGHSQLSQASWRGVDLKGLVRQELEPFAKAASALTDGPTIVFARYRTSRVADPARACDQRREFGAVLGARAALGQMDVRGGRHSEGRLVIDWRESGGPEVMPAARASYGSRPIRELICHGVPGSSVELDLAPSGFTCRLWRASPGAGCGKVGWMTEPVDAAVRLRVYPKPSARPSEDAEILVRFDNPAPPRMPFMYHCHILEHEDHGMMGQLAVV